MRTVATCRRAPGKLHERRRKPLLGAAGAAVSTAPGKPAHQRLGGGPAIVVDSTRLNGDDWYRVVGADGSLGWITGKFASAPVSAILGQGGELSDRVVAANADTVDVQVQAVPVGATAQIVGCSDAAYPELMSQLGGGGYLDSDWLPWLRVRTGQLEGWLAPSKTELVWWPPAERTRTLYGDFQGVVRPAFLANAKQDLATYAPKSGASVRLVARDSVESWPVGAACTPSEAVFAPDGDGPRVILFECTQPAQGKIQVLAFVEAAQHSYFIVDEERRTRILRYRAADVAGDPEPELVVQLGLQASHEYESALFMATSHPSPRELAVLPLDGDDIVGTWAVDEPARSISLARASNAGVVVQRTKPQGAALVVKPAYLAVGTMHSDFLEAERDVFATPGAQLIPLEYPVTSWASGGIFETQAAACQSLDQRVVSPQARATKQDRVCGSPRTKSKVH